MPVELQGRRAVTRDISVTGVYINTDIPFSLGEPVRPTLVLEYAFPGLPVRLHCQGQVVRVERHQGNVGVAVAITDYRMEPQGTSGPVH
ncbi:MAG: PilZ domain-containing protein [Chloroflexi bacterium]|nr:PilZ domain-containing protein [Chloroflexota bacterium]